jgi:putative transposase
LLWLKEVDSTALQSSLKDLDAAYRNFFRRVKTGDLKAGFPNFKSKRNKARIRVARLHEKTTNQRNDSHHKLSTQLVKEYDLIAIEDLQAKNMVKNHKLSKAISDASWSEFKRQLQYKTTWYGKVLVEVDKIFPSSQLCSDCGHKNPEV